MILRAILTGPLVLAPPMLICWYLVKGKSLSPLKVTGMAAMFLGGALAYAHYENMGVAGLVLAIAGFVCYIEAVRKDIFLEMLRLSLAEEGEESQRAEKTK